MSLFRRMFSIGKSEAHSVLDKFEDPIKMTEQGIRDLRKDLQSSIQSLAEVKALGIRAKRESKEKKQIASDYEKKAMLLLQKGQQGSMDAAEADRLASQALTKKEESMTRALSVSKDLKQNEQMVANLESKIQQLKTQISKWENELNSLKARAKVSSATKKINKQLASVDSSSTVSMLEKMQDRVAEDEALAQSYGELAASETTIDDEIDAAIGSGQASPETSDSLAKLKDKMGIPA